MTVTFDDFTILSSDSNYFNFLIKEVLLITSENHILSETFKSFPL